MLRVKEYSWNITAAKFYGSRIFGSSTAENRTDILADSLDTSGPSHFSTRRPSQIFERSQFPGSFWEKQRNTLQSRPIDLQVPKRLFSGLIRFLRHRRGIMFSHCLPRCMSHAKIGSTIGQPRQPRQHAVRAGKYIPVPTWTHPQAASPLPCKNGIVRTAGKSIIQMRLHQITAGGLQIVSRKQRGSKAERKWLGVPIRFHSHSHIAYVTFVFAVKLHKLKKICLVM